MAKSAGGRFETRAWLQLYGLPNLSDRSDKQGTWTLMTVCEENRLRYDRERRVTPGHT